MVEIAEARATIAEMGARLSRVEGITAASPMPADVGATPADTDVYVRTVCGGYIEWLHSGPPPEGDNNTLVVTILKPTEALTAP